MGAKHILAARAQVFFNLLDLEGRVSFRIRGFLAAQLNLLAGLHIGTAE